MKNQTPAIKLLLASALLLVGTGCFRVSSETRALRDAALDNGLKGADEKIEIALGRLTFAAANFGLGFVQTDEIPPEARQILRSVKGAEVSVYQFDRRTGGLASIMNDADKALAKRGCERLVGVINGDELVAVYIPKKMRSPRDIKFSVLVIAENNLVCASARGDVRTIMEVALGKAQEHLPPIPETLAMKQ